LVVFQSRCVLAGGSGLALSAADRFDEACLSLELPTGTAGRYVVAAGRDDRDLIGA